MPYLNRKWAGLVLVILAAVVLAACGGSNSSKIAGARASASAAAPHAEQTVGSDASVKAAEATAKSCQSSALAAGSTQGPVSLARSWIYCMRQAYPKGSGLRLVKCGVSPWETWALAHHKAKKASDTAAEQAANAALNKALDTCATEATAR